MKTYTEREAGTLLLEKLRAVDLGPDPLIIGSNRVRYTEQALDDFVAMFRRLASVPAKQTPPTGNT